MNLRSVAPTPRWIYLAWLGLALLLTLLLPLMPASANHAWTDPWLHLNNLHSNSPGQGANDEEFCVQSISNSIGNADARSRVNNTFWGTGYPRWDGLQKGDGHADWRVDMYSISEPCTQSSRRSELEIEFWWSKYNWEWDNAGWTQVPKKWCQENTSCVKHDLAVWHGGGQQPHTDYEWYYVYLDLDVADTHNINHEMGHVLGLKDGDGSCPRSIMHDRYYGCTENLLTPSSPDIDSVRWVTNQ